jgi:uncharacterized protein
MRGVIPARILMEIERRCGRPLSDVFDLVVGTSTGGIIACLIAAGVPMKAALDFYFDAGPRIFPASWWRTVKQALAVKYGNTVLKVELQNAIGDRWLHEAKTKVMVTTLTNRARAEMVKSWHADWADLRLWEAALMTSAAQTYFPQARVGRRDLGYLDGGNVRNNPMVCARDEALRLWHPEPIFLLQVGTGEEENPEKLPDAGAAFWAAKLFSTTTKGDDSFDQYGCDLFAELPLGFTYRKLDVTLGKYPAMDDARQDTLQELVDVTQAMLVREGLALTDICEVLRRKEA